MDFDLLAKANFAVPSAIQHFDNLIPGIDFYIKRDDQIHGLVSGNKWRKLRYILKNEKLNGTQTLVSCGGPYSNHLLALACAGSVFGFKTKGFLRGELPTELNPTLKLCVYFGMELLPVSRTEFRDIKKIFDQRYSTNPNCSFIPEGGNTILAEIGCREIIDEIDQHFDHIFVGIGTGTTLRGLAHRANELFPKTKVHGVLSLKVVQNQELNARIHMPNTPNVVLHYDYHHGGFGKYDTNLMALSQSFAQKTGIVFDQVYNAKNLAAIVDLANKNYFKPHSKVLMLHTGGQLGILGAKIGLEK